MSEHNDERTVLATRLAPEAAANPAQPEPLAANHATESAAAPVVLPGGGELHRHGHGLNPLVRAANPLLDLVVPLRFAASMPDIEALRVNLVRAIKNFEAEARAQQIDSQAIAIARYALCTFLDETIACTPWGGGGVWASRSLLVAFHNEAWGGEKFFQILQRLAQEPGNNVQVLELLYLCLSLGLEGRYRVAEGGRAQVEGLRDRLQKLVQLQRGPQGRELSLHWQPSEGKRKALFGDLPVWGLAAGVAALILAVRFTLSWALSAQADPLVERMDRLQTYGVALPPPRVPAPAAAPAKPLSLAELLAPEIAHGFVRVEEREDETLVTLVGNGVFASASDEVSDAFLPLIDRIGQALAQSEGQVTITGHTDDVPSRRMRHASNDELSLARAEAVMAILARQVTTPGRLQAEGRGDAEPLVPNTSAQNRARNRRVEMHIQKNGAAR